MAIDIITVRQGGILRPFSMDDEDSLHSMAENKPLKNHITGASKARSYTHLCAYKGSCGFIASHHFGENESSPFHNKNMDSKRKVDEMTKVMLGFVDGFVSMPDGSIHWLTRSLAYDSCNHPDSVKFIQAALELHASHAGVSVDEYIHVLNTKGFTDYVF